MNTHLASSQTVLDWVLGFSLMMHLSSKAPDKKKTAPCMAPRIPYHCHWVLNKFYHQLSWFYLGSLLSITIGLDNCPEFLNLPQSSPSSAVVLWSFQDPWGHRAAGSPAQPSGIAAMALIRGYHHPKKGRFMDVCSPKKPPVCTNGVYH